MPPAPWESYTLPDIWKMLRHESTCTGADRILDWDALTHDLRTQHRRLTEARADLAAAWPPDKNTSARTFLDHIDILTTAMQQTLTRAEDTRAGLRGIIEAISEAQLTVQPLINQRTTITTDLIPRWADHAEDEYDAKAQQAMKKAESAIADHTAQLQPPALYNADSRHSEIGTDITGDDRDAGNPGANPIPVPVPHDPPPPSAAVGGISAGTTPRTGTGGGPGLAGVIAPPPPTTASPQGAAASPVQGLGSSPIIGGGILGLPTGRGPGGETGIFGGVPTSVKGRTISPGRQAVPIRGAMPSGTVIGRGGTKAGSGAGMIGQQPGMRPAPATQNKKRRPIGGSPVDGAPDQTWEVLDGVAPVIRPKRRRHDHSPGPGVIGVDR